MGNRAVITTLGNPNGVYLHWNGGRDSVAPLAFYAYNFITDERDPACYFDLTPEGRINGSGLRLWIEREKTH